MNARRVLLPAITATSVMTMFSYLIAHYENKNFSESELLARFEKKRFHLPKQIAFPAGWATHYAVGIVMIMLFEFYKKHSNKQSAFYQTIIFGALSGLLGISAWKVLFKMLPQRSNNFYKKFYTQLFVAHFFFSAIAVITQNTANKY